MMPVFSWASLSPALPELFLVMLGMVMVLAGLSQSEGSTRSLCRVAIGGFALALMMLLSVNWDSAPVMNGMFVMDHFAGFMKLLILLGLMAAVALSVRYLEQEEIDRFEYPVLIVFAGLGMMLMVSAHNLLAMYVGLELQSLSLYVLAAFRRNHSKSSEAGIKYFVLGALASGMLLFGASLVYGYTGALSFDAISHALAEGKAGAGLVIGLVFLLVGLAFKVSAVPFHMWTPDVYEGAPTSVTALFAIVPKIAAMGLLMRLLTGPFGSIMPEWQQVVWALSLASMAVGAFAGLVQNNIKRLLAYSSIGNMGYALVGVAAGTASGMGAVILYLAIYMIMTAGTFGVVLSMRRGGRAYEDIEDLSGLSRTNPLMAWTFAFFMFSMSGIPPLAGFFGKLFIFQAAIASQFYVLAVLGVLCSVVAAYYYLRVIKVIFFDDPLDALDGDLGFSLRAVVFLSIAFVLFFIFSPDTLVETSRNAAAALFAG